MMFEHTVGKQEVLEFGGLGWYIGMPLIAHANYPERKTVIQNTHVYRLKEINAEKAWVTHVQTDKSYYIPTSKLTTVMRGGWAETVCRAQGITIREKFNIVGASKMNLNEFYTALSRTTKWSDVCIVGAVAAEYKRVEYKHECTPMDYLPLEIQEGQIYEISCADKSFVYVGLTTGSLQNRLEEHMLNPTNERMAEALKKKDVTIRGLDKVVSTKRQLMDLETRLIHEAENMWGPDRCLNVAKRMTAVPPAPEKKPVVEETKQYNLPVKPVREKGKNSFRVRSRRKNFQVDECYAWGDNEDYATETDAENAAKEACEKYAVFLLKG
jgi:hypothetical protein